MTIRFTYRAGFPLSLLDNPPPSTLFPYFFCLFPSSRVLFPPTFSPSPPPAHFPPFLFSPTFSDIRTPFGFQPKFWGMLYRVLPPPPRPFFFFTYSFRFPIVFCPPQPVFDFFPPRATFCFVWQTFCYFCFLFRHVHFPPLPLFPPNGPFRWLIGFSTLSHVKFPTFPLPQNPPTKCGFFLAASPPGRPRLSVFNKCRYVFPATWH